MITLITGAPGTGKTNALVSLLESIGKDRAVYAFGIPDLKIPHEALDDPTTWPDTVPDGSAIVLDEVQNVWRPRGPGQKVPDHVAKLETHRHRGLDFYIITQGPNLVDSNVRALVGRHVHLRDLGILGRWWYEWPECADNCRTSWKNAPIKKRYRLDKTAQQKYKSASIHVKPVRSIPWMLAVMVVALIIVGVMTWFGYSAINKKMHPAAANPAQAPGVVATATLGQPQTISAAADERVDFMPRMYDRPWTAPAYDHLRQVVALPTITGALCMRGACTCYHGKGKLLDVSSEACSAWMRDQPFNPYEVPSASSYAVPGASATGNPYQASASGVGAAPSAL